MTDATSAPVRITVRVIGHVQAVGFRWSTATEGKALGLVGFAQNQDNGDVLVVAEGPRQACERLFGWLRGEPATAMRRPGRVDELEFSWGAATGEYRRFDAY